MLSQMVCESGAKSTDYTAPEPAEEAESKCAEAATRWAKASEPPMGALAQEEALGPAGCRGQERDRVGSRLTGGTKVNTGNHIPRTRDNAAADT